MILGERSFMAALGLARKKDNELPLQELFWAPSGRQAGRQAGRGHEILGRSAGRTSVSTLISYAPDAVSSFSCLS